METCQVVFALIYNSLVIYVSCSCTNIISSLDQERVIKSLNLKKKLASNNIIQFIYYRQRDIVFVGSSNVQ